MSKPTLPASEAAYELATDRLSIAEARRRDARAAAEAAATRLAEAEVAYDAALDELLGAVGMVAGDACDALEGKPRTGPIRDALAGVAINFDPRHPGGPVPDSAIGHVSRLWDGSRHVRLRLGEDREWHVVGGA